MQLLKVKALEALSRAPWSWPDTSIGLELQEVLQPQKQHDTLELSTGQPFPAFSLMNLEVSSGGKVDSLLSL